MLFLLAGEEPMSQAICENEYIYSLPTSLTMTNDILLFTLDITAASQEIQLLRGRITQQFTPYIFVAILPDMSDIDKLKCSREQQYGPLDDKSKIAFDAWHLFQAKLSAKKDIADLTEGLPWDAPGFEPPLKLGASDIGGDEILRTTGTATSLYLIGSVAMGLVIVSSTMPGLTFTYDETIKTVAEVMQGLQFLTHAEAQAKVSFVYNIHIKTIDEIPPPPDFCGDKYDPCEAIWRDPVLQQLGFPPKEESLVTFANQLKDNNKTDWSFVAFFTKYPLYHFAYAGGVRSCMQYSNGNWGPDNIHKVFAHEVAHIFGAADEYQESNCNCDPSGYLQIANKNCVNCAGQHVPCLMDENTLSICDYTRKQLGWSSKIFNPKLFKQITPVCDNNNNLFVFAVDVHNTPYLTGRYLDVWSGSWDAHWRNAPDLQFVTALWDYSNTVHVFGIGTDNTLHVNIRSNNKWGSWQANWYQAPRLASISAFTDRDNNVYVFGIAPDNTVYLNRHAGNSWSGWRGEWYNVPNLMSIAAVADRGNNLFIFGIGTDNTVYLNSHEGDSWSGWQYNWNFAPKLKSILPALGIANTVYVFGIGMDNTVHVNFRSAGKWSGWFTGWGSLPQMETIYAATDNQNVLYLWGIGMDGLVYLNKNEVERQWTGWQANWGKPRDFYKPNLHFITAVFDRNNVPHVWGIGVNNYVMGNNNIEYFNWRNGNNWFGWEYQWSM
jgi:hypothetical protein